MPELFKIKIVRKAINMGYYRSDEMILQSAKNILFHFPILHSLIMNALMTNCLSCTLILRVKISLELIDLPQVSFKCLLLIFCLGLKAILHYVNLGVKLLIERVDTTHLLGELCSAFRQLPTLSRCFSPRSKRNFAPLF